jgi:pyruvate dehydrogenase E2 component (dihydrolipoamide acetyltransferase)
MMAVEVVIPALGLTVEKGKILKWLKREGETVAKGESLYEVEADKVTTEVESPASGVVGKILISEGIEVPILTVVAVITDEKEMLPEKYLFQGGQSPAKEKTGAVVVPSGEPLARVTAAYGEIKALPAARRFARERGVDLFSLKGSGPGGAILVRDVEAFLAKRGPTDHRVLSTPTARRLAEREEIPLSSVRGTGPAGRVMKADVLEAKSSGKVWETKRKHPVPKGPPLTKYELGQVIPMNSMRKVIAKRMVQSKLTAPHIHFFNELDMGKLTSLREEILSDFEIETGVRISINDFFIKAVALTLREYPLLNARVSGEEIRIFPEINVGLAIAVEEGLIVPAIPKADQLGLGEIAVCRADLVGRARAGKLTLEEMERGTFTISSLAKFDITFFTAVLNPPQSGILTLGKMEEVPVVREGQVVIRKILKQGLSVDHRIVDGAVAAEFLQCLKRRVENPYCTFLKW